MPVRVGIIGLPKLLGDVIAESFSSDNVLVGQLPHDGDTPAAVAQLLRCDVVIAGVEDPLDNTLLDQIVAALGPRLLGVRTDGRQAWICQLRIDPHAIVPASPGGIRAAALAGHQGSR